MTVQIVYSDNLLFLKAQPEASYDLIYVDPPFNTGKTQVRTQLRVKRNDRGTRVGFGGCRYDERKIGSRSISDTFTDYFGFLEPRLEEAFRILKPEGSLFLHLDYREVHYAKVLLDCIFGRDSFMNEIVWAYDYGARSRTRWSAKHDNILWYAKNPKRYCFNYEEIDRIPYMAPDLVGEEKAKQGKVPTSVWWHTIVPTNGKEKTGYPTQKPRGIIDRIVRVHSNVGDRLLDFFAGSGTFGESGATFGRNVVLVDSSAGAIHVMTKRLAQFEPQLVHW